ncbi:MAG: glycosyltransferase family 4 protein [Bdellovibrionales bacterium]|nr:glycosyltransferase family 4 protein [Bdellovibrionales bacterium]
MKILFHIDSEHIGGYELQLSLLGKALQAAGHTIDLVCPRGPVLELFGRHNQTHFNLDVSDLLLDDQRPDLVLTVRGSLARVARLAKKRSIPVVWFCGYRPALLPHFALWRELLPGLMDHIFVPSDWLCAAVQREVPGVPVSTLPCAVDTNLFGPASHGTGLRQALGFSESQPIIAYAARLRSHKRHHDLLRAIKSIERLLPDAALLLLGWTSASDALVWEQLHQQIVSLQLEDRVRFVTALPEAVPDFLSVADVFVSPAQNEAMGCAVLEAMARQLPVIAASPVGCESLIQNTRSGLTYPVGDTAALGRCLLRLLDSKTLRTQMGLRGRKAVQQFHTIQHTEAHFLHTARKLLSCVAACSA